MSPLSPAIAKLETQVEALFNLTQRASARFRFLKPMLDNRKLIDRIESEKKGVGFTQLRSWLYWSLVLELSKLCRDNDERSPSIHAIRKRLANDASLVQALEDKYARNNREMFDEAALRAEFRNIWKRFEKAADEMLGGRVAGGYRTIRNKLIGHNELRKDGQFHDVKDERLKYGDERALLKTLRELVTDLALIVQNTDVESAWNTSDQWDDEIAFTFWDLDSSKGSSGKTKQNNRDSWRTRAKTLETSTQSRDVLLPLAIPPQPAIRCRMTDQLFPKRLES